MAAFYLIGAALTAVLYPVLFAKRYRGRRTWVVVGIVLGLVAALLWPLTLWVAVALLLTGFTRPRTGVQRRRRIVFPLAAGGSLATFVIIGMVLGPAPASTPSTPAAVADVVVPTTSALPTTTPAPTTTPPLASTAAVAPITEPPATRPPTTTTRLPATTTRTPDREPEPRRVPERERESDNSGTRPRTGNSGHPCGPGERDGDNDGYCGER